MLQALLTAVLLAHGGNHLASLPSVDEVVARMVERDDARRAALQSYTSTRRYVLENMKHHKQAEMLVHMTYRPDGSRDFEIVSSTGWGGARKHVFPRLLEAESESAKPGSGEDARMTPQNYSFSMLNVTESDGRETYVIKVEPRVKKKYLMRGIIWVDTQDFAIVRMDGEPAKNPSFWIKRVNFTHKYEKHGPFWLAESDRSISDVRIFGATELRIDYLEYNIGDEAEAPTRLQ